MHLLLRYTQAMITQMEQTAVCNHHHSLDQKLCRWLLLSLNRLQGSELVMKQELIASMLGVRREGVTEGALKLQAAGLIKYVPGRITVLDRRGLEKRTCECYAVVKKKYDWLLPAQLAAYAAGRLTCACRGRPPPSRRIRVRWARCLSCLCPCFCFRAVGVPINNLTAVVGSSPYPSLASLMPENYQHADAGKKLR